MEGEGKVEELSIEDFESPVKYWQERSRRAMEAMGMAVVRPGPVPLPPALPPGVKREVKGDCDELPIGLICNTCSTSMPQFTRLVKCTVHYYDKEATVPFKLFLYCVNMKCKAEMIVERNKEVNDYVVLSGATRYSSPAEEDNSGSRVHLPIAGSSSAGRSEDTDHAGDFDRALGSDANDRLISYYGRMYLGGQNPSDRFRDALRARELRRCQPSVGRKTQNPTDRFRKALRAKELRRRQPAAAPDANGRPISYYGRIYLGGPRAQRSLRDAQQARARALRSLRDALRARARSQLRVGAIPPSFRPSTIN